jgi:hypothetical protein
MPNNLIIFKRAAQGEPASDMAPAFPPSTPTTVKIPRLNCPLCRRSTVAVTGDVAVCSYCEYAGAAKEVIPPPINIVRR